MFKLRKKNQNKKSENLTSNQTEETKNEQKELTNQFFQEGLNQFLEQSEQIIKENEIQFLNQKNQQKSEKISCQDFQSSEEEILEYNEEKQQEQNIQTYKNQVNDQHEFQPNLIQEDNDQQILNTFEGFQEEQNIFNQEFQKMENSEKHSEFENWSSEKNENSNLISLKSQNIPWPQKQLSITSQEENVKEIKIEQNEFNQIKNFYDMNEEFSSFEQISNIKNIFGQKKEEFKKQFQKFVEKFQTNDIYLLSLLNVMLNELQIDKQFFKFDLFNFLIEQYGENLQKIFLQPKFMQQNQKLTLEETNKLLWEFLINKKDIFTLQDNDYIFDLFSQQFEHNNYFDRNFLILAIKTNNLNKVLSFVNIPYFDLIMICFIQSNKNNLNQSQYMNAFHQLFNESKNDYFKLICLILNMQNFLEEQIFSIFQQGIEKFELNILIHFFTEIVFFWIYEIQKEKQQEEQIIQLFLIIKKVLLKQMDLIFLSKNSSFIKDKLLRVNRINLRYTNNLQEQEIDHQKILFYQNKFNQEFMEGQNQEDFGQIAKEKIFGFVNNFFGSKKKEGQQKQDNLTYCEKRKRYLLNGEVLSENEEEEKKKLEEKQEDIKEGQIEQLKLLPPKKNDVYMKLPDVGIQRKNKLAQKRFVAFNAYKQN